MDEYPFLFGISDHGRISMTIEIVLRSTRYVLWKSLFYAAVAGE
jgi:hypothetical protein